MVRLLGSEVGLGGDVVEWFVDMEIRGSVIEEGRRGMEFGVDGREDVVEWGELDNGVREVVRVFWVCEWLMIRRVGER